MNRTACDIEIGFSLGSNLGDRKNHLTAAKKRILDEPHGRLAAQSSLYETEPVGVKAEYHNMDFLNAVMIVESRLPVEYWLHRLAAIEKELGRPRSGDRFAPRPMDVDILYAGNSCIDSDGLTIPHPRWSARRFVVAPLAEVRPDLILPGMEYTVQQILQTLDDHAACQQLHDSW